MLNEKIYRSVFGNVYLSVKRHKTEEFESLKREVKVILAKMKDLRSFG